MFSSLSGISLMLSTSQLDSIPSPRQCILSRQQQQTSSKFSLASITDYGFSINSLNNSISNSFHLFGHRNSQNFRLWSLATWCGAAKPLFRDINQPLNTSPSTKKRGIMCFLSRVSSELVRWNDKRFYLAALSRSSPMRCSGH